MSMVPRVATAATLVLAAALNGSRRRLVRHFERARAVTEADAVELPRARAVTEADAIGLPAARPFQAMWVSRLRTHLVLFGAWWIRQGGGNH